MVVKTILPGQTIGIIGGGQLGRMMAIAAKEMGYKIAVLDPTKNSPTGQIADMEVVAPFHDLDAAKRLAETSDIITYEFENIDVGVLAWLEDHAYLPQGSELIRTTQDRAYEKEAIEKSNAKVVPYYLVNTLEDLTKATQIIGIPSVLKTRRGGYDGKGQVMIRDEADVKEAKTLLKYGPCILEKFLDFEQEISVVVNRSVAGETKAFPVAENIHVDHILMQSIVPARISENIKTQAESLAINLAESMQMVGTLGVEMFLTRDGDIFINELAPRPHNSGHYTMNGCNTSQFEQHIRAICNWPLGSTKLIDPIVMMNILGEHMEKTIEAIPQFDSCKLHLYGKDEVKHKRKMGHLNILGEDVESIIEKINTLTIWLPDKQEAKQ
ncbi:5-(carboxyamino)imidazole ribonucleotide synthase [Salirhabdus euzebyi]|uniref:5-(carboxyamino)imidazole ribonucleotide synthase n=1 Tax=Salirhabdus euzebyi TaxID=394506 RepID=UPI00157A3230|nr:5-(carboxyamino)imidazole ribonucleotide synthase [Salirhabdus euzebyi]